ncbi:MAG TPA: hypothetical protein VHD59_06865 [Pseudolabrys sp.]|nr:hypothetical protein [Pseudolabrys sp.]
MKIVDTIKAFAANEGEDAVTAAVKAVQDARALHGKLYQQGEQLHRQRGELEVKLGTVALDDRAAFDALDKEHQKTLADIRHNTAAQEAASARLEDAQRKLNALTTDNFLHKLEKKARQTERQASELEEAERTYIAKINLLIKGRDELATMLQERGAGAPQGLALGGRDILELVALDLFRLNPVGPLAGGQYRTPGAVDGALLDAAKIAPLSATIKQCNAALMQELRATPVQTASVVAEAEPEPQPAEPLNVPSAPRLNAPTPALSAEQIMPAIKTVHLTLENGERK